MALLLWLNSGLLLAVTRFFFTRLGILDGWVRETALFCVTCIPFIYLFIGFLAAPKKTIPRRVFVFAGIYLSVVIAFALTLLLNPEISKFYFREDYGIGRVFRPDGAMFAFLIFSLFDDPDELNEALKKAVYVFFFFQLIVVFYPVMRRGYWVDIAPDGSEMHVRYSLSFGYDMLLPLMVFFINGVRTRKLRHYAFAAASALLIVTNGGRGAMVMVVVFFALLTILYFIDRKASLIKKTLIVGAIMAAVFAYVFFFDLIMQKLIVFLNSHGISSRTIEMLVNGSFSSTNGRDRIWSVVSKEIARIFPLGHGLFGDRPYVAPIHVAGYSHNLFLELLVCFGIVGAAVIVYLIADAVRMLLICKDKRWRIVYLILFTCSLKLMLSFTLWYVWEFWAAAAVAYRYRKNRRGSRNGSVLREQDNYEREPVADTGAGPQEGKTE